MTTLLCASLPDVDGASGWKPMPMPALHGPAVPRSAALCGLWWCRHSCWPLNLARSFELLDRLPLPRCMTPLPDVSMAACFVVERLYGLPGCLEKGTLVDRDTQHMEACRPSDHTQEQEAMACT